jgi:hypothetical protein
VTIQTSRRLMTAVVLVGGAFIGVPTPARGGSIFYSQVLVQTIVACPITGVCLSSQDTGILEGTDTAGPLETSISGSGGATATAFGSMVNGVLHASATGSGGTAIGDGWNGVAHAIFYDTITLVSNSLNHGDQVQLQFALDLDYSLAASCSPAWPTSESSVRAHIMSNLGGVRQFDHSGAAADINDGPQVLTALIGQQITFGVHLETVAFGTGRSSGYADAANTFRFSLHRPTP